MPTFRPVSRSKAAPTPDEATPIEPGQYVDTLIYPQERWYSIDLAAGDRVRATAAIVGNGSTPDLPGVISEMFLGFGDVIGTSPCDTDLATGIGPFTQNLAVDGVQVQGGTVCSDPGVYVIGVSVPEPENREEEQLMEGVELPIELFVAVTSDPVEEQAVEEEGAGSADPGPAARGPGTDADTCQPVPAGCGHLSCRRSSRWQRHLPPGGAVMSSRADLTRTAATLLLVLLLGGVAGPALAQTKPVDGASEDVPAIEGAANPLDAPVVPPGVSLDSIIQSETLWYAIDAGPGQDISLDVTILAQPDGPEADETLLVASIADGQRQPMVGGDAVFSGLEDVTVSLGPAELPVTGRELPLVSLSLTPPTAGSDLEGRAYRVSLTITVDGEPLPEPSGPATTSGAQSDTASGSDPLVTAAPLPDRAPPNYVADLLPVIVVALAIGGFAGFELSRRGL